jgi:hypothetical protein
MSILSYIAKLVTGPSIFAKLCIAENQKKIESKNLFRQAIFLK